MIFLCVFLFAGCPTEGGSSGPDIAIGIDLHDQFPEPETFSTNSTQYKNIPNLFKSYLGATVAPADWENRRKEMLQVAQHYLLGYMPPTEGITTTFEVSGANLAFTISNGTVAHTFNVPFYLPSGTAPAAGWPVVLYFGNPQTNIRTIYTDAGIALLGVTASQFDAGDNESGYMYGNSETAPGSRANSAVHKLFSYTYGWSNRVGHDGTRTNTDPTNYRDLASRGDPDAPGILINWAWGFSRIIDALEAEAAKPAAQRQIAIDPTKIAVTGISRNGKGALMVGAFDDRVAVTNPVSSGSAGVVLERWVATAATEQQILTNSAISPTINMAYYYIKRGDPVTVSGAATTWFRAATAQEALVNPAGDPSGGTTAEKTPANATAGEWTAGPNIKSGYVVVNFGINTDAMDGVHQGTQTLVDCRWGYPGWFGTRFWGWPNPHPNVNIAYRPNRGDNGGYLDNADFDMHFLTAAVAPRGLLYHDGIMSNNTSPEAEYFSYLVTREAYRFLGVEKNIGIRLYDISHANPAREHADLVSFMKAYLADTDPGLYYRQNYFPLNDPRTSWNYKYLDWAAPGYKSLKTQVEEGYAWADNYAPQDLAQPAY